MELKEFKQHIESFPKGTKFSYGISKPFSWRGSYDEVAFSIIENEISREDILKNRISTKLRIGSLSLSFIRWGCRLLPLSRHYCWHHN